MATSERPRVSVVCPYVGPPPALEVDADEVILEDDNPGGSSYAARDRAARRATGDWLVFVDADCAPEPGWLDGFFAAPVPGHVGVLAGAVLDAVVEDTLVARYIRARAKMAQPLGGPRPYAQTANCAVRRSAFLAVGGWPEPIVSGGDADLCWRLAAAGWRLESRPDAVVRHRNRASVAALVRQLHRHGRGMRWLDERWPGAFPPPTARELLGRPRMLLRDPTAFGVLDLVGLYARDSGRLRGNR